MIVICISQDIYGQEKSLLTKTDDFIYCLDSSEFKISEFYCGQPKIEVYKILGKPDSLWIQKDLPDSLWFEKDLSETHFYKGINISYDSAGYSNQISVKSDKFITPSGIHIGLTKTQVTKILGIKPDELLTIKWEDEFKNCKQKMYFALLWDDSFILNEIVIGTDLPFEENSK